MLSDEAVLAALGIDESAFLGRGGEARVFALDAERVVRLPHPGSPTLALEERRRLFDALPTMGDVALPQVLDHLDIGGRTVVVERRLPGRTALDVLAEPGTDRDTLIRDYLDVAARIADLPCPTSTFGELFETRAIAAPTFEGWAVARLEASHALAGDLACFDPARLTADLLAALPEPDPPRPFLVHLDAFLGNMLADNDRITALLDFGPTTIGGVPHLDPVVAVAYLAPEITPTAIDDDRATARAWAADRGLRAALAPAERWMAAYWSAIHDDHHLRRWCRRVLIDSGKC